MDWHQTATPEALSLRWADLRAIQTGIDAARRRLVDAKPRPFLPDPALVERDASLLALLAALEAEVERQHELADAAAEALDAAVAGDLVAIG